MIRTAGWLRVYAVDDAMSLATIEHACDSIEVGGLPRDRSCCRSCRRCRTTNQRPSADNYAHVMARASISATRLPGATFFTIDRGSSQGVSPGAQFVRLSRQHAAQNFLFELGEAVAVDVRQDTSTLQVTLSRDAFTEGDYVAQRK
jgi:hypothetical protein